jgi:hypothetical protein
MSHRHYTCHTSVTRVKQALRLSHKRTLVTQALHLSHNRYNCQTSVTLVTQASHMRHTSQALQLLFYLSQHIKTKIIRPSRERIRQRHTIMTQTSLKNFHFFFILIVFFWSNRLNSAKKEE